MTAALEARRLSRRFVDKWALHPTSFELAAAETLAVVGPSGAGKTTLARLLVGLETPTEGEVWVEGEILRSRPRAHRKRVQLVYQVPGEVLDPRNTGDQILEPFLGAEARATALGRVGLGPEVLQRRPHELSGGQKQRLVLARALAVKPSVLVLDEPLSALDRGASRQIERLLFSADSALSSVAKVLITHDLNLVVRRAQRVLVLSDGQTVEQGAVSDVLAAPAHPLTKLLVESTRRLTGLSRVKEVR